MQVRIQIVDRFQDDEFDRSWIQNAVYGKIQSQRLQFVLKSIERFKRSNLQETDQLSAELTLEHVLPQEWQKHWPLGNGIEYTIEDFEQATKLIQARLAEEDDTAIGQIIRRQRLLNTFGNLTLLTGPGNSKMSNRPFAEKRIELRKHSVLLLNNEIAECEEWGERQIEERGKKLLCIAKKLWPFPNQFAPSIVED